MADEGLTGLFDDPEEQRAYEEFCANQERGLEPFDLNAPALVCRWRMHNKRVPLLNRHIRALSQRVVQGEPLTHNMLSWAKQHVEWSLTEGSYTQRDGVLMLVIDVNGNAAMSVGEYEPLAAADRASLARARPPVAGRRGRDGRGARGVVRRRWRAPARGRGRARLRRAHPGGAAGGDARHAGRARIARRGFRLPRSCCSSRTSTAWSLQAIWTLPPRFRRARISPASCTMAWPSYSKVVAPPSCARQSARPSPLCGRRPALRCVDGRLDSYIAVTMAVSWPGHWSAAAYW